jgi:hypothetical protein
MLIFLQTGLMLAASVDDEQVRVHMEEQHSPRVLS